MAWPIQMNGGGLWRGRLLTFDKLPSTNGWAVAHAAKLRDGDVVWAGRQTAGRGRFARTWLSPQDRCLTLSLVLKGGAYEPFAPNLGQAAAIAVSTMLAGGGIAASLKWPNDILVGDRKIAGILAESANEPDCWVVGIGLNVNMGAAELAAIDRPATSLALELGEPVAVHELLPLLTAALRNALARLLAGGTAWLLATWQRHDALLGEQIEAVSETGTLCGSYAGLGPHGEMLLERAGGKRQRIWSADVERIRAGRQD